MANTTTVLQEASTNAKPYTEYGYTNGLNDFIYLLPDLTMADAEVMFGQGTDPQTHNISYSLGSATHYEYANGISIAYLDNTGQVYSASIPLDIAVNGLKAVDVKNDKKITRVANYFRSHGHDVKEYASDTHLVFRVPANNCTLCITSNANFFKISVEVER